jgi:hypothetical protein
VTTLRHHSAAFIMLFIMAAAMQTGCTEIVGAVREGWYGFDYEGRMLPASEGLGADALRNRMDKDPDVRRYIRERGQPDFVHSEGVLKFHVFYIKDNAHVTFNTPAVGFRTAISSKPIDPDVRDALLKMGRPASGR